jgi:hypothetical protein
MPPRWSLFPAILYVLSTLATPALGETLAFNACELKNGALKGTSFLGIKHGLSTNRERFSLVPSPFQMNSGEPGRGLVIEKQRTFVLLYTIQESALKTRKELIFLGKVLKESTTTESQVETVVESVGARPWNPDDENTDKQFFSPVMPYKKTVINELSAIFANPVKTFSMHITNPIHPPASRLQLWIYMRIISAISAEKVAEYEDTSDDDMMKVAEIIENLESFEKVVAELSNELDNIEKKLRATWKEYHRAEAAFEHILQHMQSITNGQQYSSSEEFRCHIAAGLAYLRRAGRPSTLFSPTQPLLRSAACDWGEWTWDRLAPAADDAEAVTSPTRSARPVLRPRT